MMAKSYRPRGRMPALITYIIAVVFLLLGLTLPIGVQTFTGGDVPFGEMPLLQLTGALKSLGVIKNIPFGSELTPAFSFNLTISGFKLNIGAALLILYALVSLVALFMIIPMCVAKKKNSTPRKVAAVTECVALGVLLPLCAMAFTRAASEWNLMLFAAFGVTGLMLIVQSIVYFRKSGVIKTVTLVISAIAVFFTVANAADNLPFLRGPINNLVSMLQRSRPFETTAGLYKLNDKVFFGSTVLKEALISPSSLAWNIAAGITNYTAFALSALVCLNLLLNALGLGKRTNMFMLAANGIRYILELILIMVLFIAVFAAGGSFGLGLYILTVLSIAQLVIAVVRFLRYRRTAAVSEEEDEDADEADPAEDYAFEGEKTESKEGEKAPEKAAAVETRDVVYNMNTIYNGPSDDFIKKLTNEEKVEFARVFLEKSTANLTMLPDYVVGGDNAKFFSSIFIYLAHVRSVITDGLMNKLYDEVVRING